MGFGVSVVQRLCKTSVKKNLYYEIKDKVIEEAFNGVRSVKKTEKVRVYGTDSNREVRARLIEILYDRVALHKDKFIAPILHHELESMEVKKSGKVEHAQNAHDDQVFSYLMALRVWYDGIDIAERYGIQKNTIKTDEDVDIEALSIEEADGGLQKVDVESMAADSVINPELEEQLDYIRQASTYRLGRQFENDQYESDQECLRQLLSTDKNARKAYAKQNHLDFDEPSIGGILNGSSGGFVELPDSIFGNTELMDDDNQYHDNIVGNLSDQWRGLL